jgi:hypothetical protein
MQCQKLILGKRKINVSFTFTYPKVMKDLLAHQPECQMQHSLREDINYLEHTSNTKAFGAI